VKKVAKFQYFGITAMLLLLNTDETSCSEGDIRLAGSVGDYQGHVEICHLHIWNTLCSSTWDRNDGIVACYQLGLEFAKIPTHHTYGTGTGQILLNELSCTGSEAKLTDCPHYKSSSNYCYNAANLICVSKYQDSSVSCCQESWRATPWVYGQKENAFLYMHACL